MWNKPGLRILKDPKETAWAFDNLFFLIAETLNINHSNPITAVDLLKKSYLGQIMVMKIVPVTESEIINII